MEGQTTPFMGRLRLNIQESKPFSTFRLLIEALRFHDPANRLVTVGITKTVEAGRRGLVSVSRVMRVLLRQEPRRPAPEDQASGATP